MTKIITLVSVLISIVVSFSLAWKRVGEKEATSKLTEEEYEKAKRLIDRLTKPLPSSSEFAAASLDALERRMRS